MEVPYGYKAAEKFLSPSDTVAIATPWHLTVVGGDACVDEPTALPAVYKYSTHN